MVRNKDKKKESDEKSKTKTRIAIRQFYSQVGKKCLMCGSNKMLACHKKDFRSHNPIANLSVRQLRLEKVQDYARLCFGCHYGVHWCYEHLGMLWEEIVAKT